MSKRAQLPQPEKGDNAGRAELRARLARFRGSRQRNILGVPEILALAASGLLLCAALFTYVYFLLPERSRLLRAGEERTKLQNELRLDTVGIKEGESTQASVEGILKSLEDFETRHLVPRHEAGTAVIEELNMLIRRNRLNIATGVSFTQLAEAATDVSPDQQKRAPAPTGIAKSLQSVFPGIAVSLTVEGLYPNLRRFIRDIEADRRFIVINAVELEGITDASARAAAAAAAAAPPTGEEGNGPPRGGNSSGGVVASPARGATLVSLRLELAAYFRRSNAPG